MPSFESISNVAVSYEQAIENSVNFLRDNELSSSIVWCQEAIKINPSRAEGYITLGHALRMGERPEMAIRAYSKALDINPQLAEVYGFLAELFYSEGDRVRSQINYLAAIKIQPSLADRYVTLDWGEEYYSLNNLDVKLKPYLNFRDGFFIEAGANNGIDQSNTLYFEKYQGWKGLLIEPIPELAEKCQVNRPECITENYALVSFENPLERVELYHCNLMSFVEGAMETDVEKDDQIKTACAIQNIKHSKLIVNAKPLSVILENHRIQNIDFFSLDVEGLELEVLKGIDFTRHKPRYMLIEVRQRERKKIDSFLSDLYEPIAELYSAVNPKVRDLSFSDRLYKLK